MRGGQTTDGIRVRGRMTVLDFREERGETEKECVMEERREGATGGGHGQGITVIAECVSGPGRRSGSGW